MLQRFWNWLKAKFSRNKVTTMSRGGGPEPLDR